MELTGIGGLEMIIISAVCCCIPAVLAAAGGIFYAMRQRGPKG